ncbi:hypothetical protein ACFX13_030348 [Malus domestica]
MTVADVRRLCGIPLGDNVEDDDVVYPIVEEMRESWEFEVAASGDERLGAPIASGSKQLSLPFLSAFQIREYGEEI